jgi:FKBP-type peptidyl-prolyl cis-trans isomerase FkpA
MIKSTLKLTVAIVLLASCSQKPAEVPFEKAPSGMEYRITHTNEKEKNIQNGQIVKLNIEYKLKSKDTTLNSTFDHIPQYLSLDTIRIQKYTLPEILTKCRKGDKIEFRINVDSLVKQGQMQYNEILKKGEIVLGRAEILEVFQKGNESVVEADFKKEVDIEKNREIKTIKDYLAKNKIAAVQTPEGVFVQIKTPGIEANKIDTSKQASINYKGYFLNGETFDTNIFPNDPKNPKAIPLEVRVGEHGVIEGWDIALTYFAKGGTGSIYIPAMLAYGPRPMSEKSKGYENLAFDIEITDVINKPAKKLQPAEMPAGMNGQPR